MSLEQPKDRTEDPAAPAPAPAAAPEAPEQDVVDLVLPVRWGSSGFTWICPDLPEVIERAVAKYQPFGSVAARRRASGEAVGGYMLLTELPSPAGDALGVDFEYLFVFAVKPEARGHRVGAVLLDEGRRRIASALGGAEPAKPRVCWLTVESDNVRSMTRFRAAPGVAHVRSLTPFVGCFAVARQHPSYGPIRPDEVDAVAARIAAQRSAAGALDLCPARLDPATYRVLRGPDGAVLAGVDATSRVHALPTQFRNWWDTPFQRLSMALGSVLPMYKRDGSSCVIALCAPLCEAGREGDWWRLCESVQAEFDGSCTILTVDPTDEMHARLEAHARAHPRANGVYGEVARSTFPFVEIFSFAIDENEATAAFLDKAKASPIVIPYHAW
eukprot:m51a1_g7411 hypothetical protein (386) ;mRNA; f:206244-207996